MAEFLSRRGLIVVISDLYDEPENIMAGLKQLKAKGNDIMVLHIMDNFELTFPFMDAAQFEDMENKRKMHIIPEYLRSQYLSIINDHIARLRKEMSGAGSITRLWIRASRSMKRFSLTWPRGSIVIRAICHF